MKRNPLTLFSLGALIAFVLVGSLSAQQVGIVAAPTQLLIELPRPVLPSDRHASLAKGLSSVWVAPGAIESVVVIVAPNEQGEDAAGAYVQTASHQYAIDADTFAALTGADLADYAVVATPDFGDDWLGIDELAHGGFESGLALWESVSGGWEAMTADDSPAALGSIGVVDGDRTAVPRERDADTATLARTVSVGGWSAATITYTHAQFYAADTLGLTLTALASTLDGLEPVRTESLPAIALDEGTTADRSLTIDISDADALRIEFTAVRVEGAYISVGIDNVRGSGR